MTEMTLTPEQKIEQAVQETQVSVSMTIKEAEYLLSIIAELPYSKVSGVIGSLMAQLVPQGQAARKEITAGVDKA